jgi:hypothetical protein
VIGQDPVRLGRLVALAVRDPRLLFDPLHERLITVGAVDGRHVLEDPGRPLEPHTRIDVLSRERRQRSVRVELELHEDEVPELEEPLAFATRGTVWSAAADLLAPVEEHLRVRPARPGAADRPEVVRARQAHDPLWRHADPLPRCDCDLVLAESELRVAGEHAHPDPVAVDLHVVEHELPGELDRALLEVLPEREVAEHLEEGQVVAVEADRVDIDDAEDLLRRRQQRRGRLLQPEEERHQGLHSSGDQEGRAVVRARDQ